MSSNDRFDLTKHPHRRLNILTGEWIQVSPHRTQRPWQGKEENAHSTNRSGYDPNCYLCPGNTRAGGQKNQDYDSVFVFDNDFGALLEDTASAELNNNDLLIARSEKGICRVVCFSPQHDLTLPEMDHAQILDVVNLWVGQYNELGQKPFVNYVQIFENKGEVMGCSNPHPHGQIWAQETIPEEPAKELREKKKYYNGHGSTLLGDYLDLELKQKDRIVVENEDFVVLVPFWAFWPFETMVVSRRPFAGFDDMSETEKGSLADIVKKITTIYDNVFTTSFPYSAGFHPAPTDGEPHPEWHFHMHFYPPLLRSATIKKFSVGYEMLANKQRDITAEVSAMMLKKQSTVHYKKG
ncbi:MAG: UDP-glucose--hexose-1-phosphate uridylyltransferase [Balneolales bacterium]